MNRTNPVMRAEATQAIHDALDRLLASGLTPTAIEALLDDALDDALERANMGATLDATDGGAA